VQDLLSLGQAAPLQLARHVAGMRPSLLESAFGLDLAVPGASGLVRVVAWVSPTRKEAQVELRLV
jgi:hypothetical protein